MLCAFIGGALGLEVIAKPKHCGVEQLVARRFHNPKVTGSSPVSATNFYKTQKKGKMEFKQYIIMAVGGIVTTAFKLLRGQDYTTKNIAMKILIGLIISVMIIPAVMEYFNLSVKIGLALTCFSTMCSEALIDIVEKKLPKKLEDKIDSL